MARVFTINPGAVLQVGHYGEATNETPAVVPVEVAARLPADVIRVELDEGEELPPVEEEAEPEPKAKRPRRGRPPGRRKK